MKWVLSLFLLATSAAVSAQIVIGANTYIKSADNSSNISTIASSLSISNQSSNTDFTKVNLILRDSIGSANKSISTSSPLTLNGLEIKGTINFDVDGFWTIANKLSLTKSKLIPKATGKLIYTGANDVEGNDLSFVNGAFYLKGKGKRTFPIGDKNGYAPAVLVDVASADANTELGFSITSTNPGFQASPTIKDFYPDRFWNMSIGTGGTFSGSKIWLSGNNVDATYRSGPTILEMTQTNTINDLGAVITDPFFYSENKVSTKPKSFAIAITKYVEVVVYKLITPNDDGYNNVLFIDGIDQNPKNEVTLLDRWGVQIKTWKNVTNAQLKDEPDTFKKLPVGNYICVVKYEEPTTGTTKTVQQMISLLK